MKGIQMLRSADIDRWTTLEKGERLMIVGGDKGGWYIGKSGKYYKTITFEAAARLIADGFAKDI